MARITANISLTLDGVMQAPGRPDEDTRGGFTHGGWAAPYNDDVMMQEMGKGMQQEGALLFGRRTYLDFHKVWHGRKDNPFSPVLERTQKYVASTTLQEPLPWANSTLLLGDAVAAVRALKQGRLNLTVLGSGALLRALMAHDLVDAFVLLVHPLVLGEGQHLFADDPHLMKLKLARSIPTTKGVTIATYERAAV